MRQSDFVFNYFFYLFENGEQFDEKKAVKQNICNYINTAGEWSAAVLIRQNVKRIERGKYMKRFYFAVIAFFLAGSVTFGQMAGDTESLIPSDVNLFVKSKEIIRLLKTFNYMVFKLMDEPQRGEFLAARNSFKDKTGIDYLDEKSLRNAGIDTGRAVSFANFEKDNVQNNTGDVMLIFLPILNEAEFPLKFIEIVKKSDAGQSDMIISPVTAVYKNITVYQIKDGLFIAPVNGYLLIGSTSDIIKRVIDAKISRKDTLILDENYKDYLLKEKNNYDFNAYITKKFLMAQGSPETAGQGKDPMYNSIEYIAGGIGFEGNKFLMNASARLSKENREFDSLIGFIKTGVQNKSLFIPSADSTLFMSMDLTNLNNFCKGEIEWCAQYNSFKNQINDALGIDMETDFIPYHTGGVNVMALDPGSSGGMGDVLVFVPMTDPGKTEELWLKIKKGMRTRYSKEKKFGEEKDGAKKGFWFIHESQMRIFVSYDQRGIYAGTSSGFLKTGLNSKTVDAAANSGRYGKVINDKTFFLFNIKKNAFSNLKSLLQMRMQSNPVLSKSINRIGEILIFCEKRDGLLSVDFELEIKDQGKKK